MKTRMINGLAILTLLLFPAVSGAESPDTAGVPEGREVVAVVNGEEIFLDELSEAVAARHQSLSEDAPAAWTGFSGALDRLIGTKLIVQEALEVGLDERPEIREKVRSFRDRILVKLLKERQLAGIAPDEDDIERVYKDEVRHWKFRVISFGDLDQARAFRGELDGGEDFDTVGERYVREGLAAWEGGEQDVREAEIAPEISPAFLDQGVGSATPVIRAFNRFFVFTLTEMYYPEDPAARQRAERKALALKRERILKEYTGRLMEKYVSVDRDVMDTIGKGDFIDAQEDLRPLAEIPGEDPCLVADLVGYLKGKSYHGGKASDYVKTLESDPDSVLSDFLEEKLYLKEARGLGIDGTRRYHKMVDDYERSLVFGMYVEEFLVPQAAVREEEALAAYEARSDEFYMPQVVVADILAFTGEDDARRALENLRRGADLKWLGENAPGLKDKGIAREELIPDTMPRDQQTLFPGVAPGATGLYEAGEGVFKVFIVRDVPPRKREPFEKVSPEIARELFGEKMNQVIEDLAAELRELSEITVYEDKLDKGPSRQGRD